MPSARLFILFFGSGACGLIYQVVWMRALTLTFSVSVYAVTTVLCAFMGGLALGAALAGRVADRLERPLLYFGVAELGVGVFGLIALPLLFGLAPAEIWLHDQFGGSGFSYSAARFSLAALVLLVPCTLMGTTLPLLSRTVVDREDFVGKGAGGLYAVNALGAVAGCLAAGFVLIPFLGLQLTTWAAAALNLVVGAIAVHLSQRSGPIRIESATEPEPVSSAPAAGDEATAAISPRALAIALGFGVSGFTALGYEVLWTRALEQFTHNSAYAYTGMLATFLLGISAGSAVAAAPADRWRRPLAVFGWIEIAIGASVVVSLLIYMQLLDWIPAAAEAVGGLQSWYRVVALIFAVAIVTMLSTTFLFGATFPFVVRAVVEKLDLVGRRVALAYTVNTVGSIIGALLVGFVMLPLLGMTGSFIVLIVGNVVLGAGLLLWFEKKSGGIAAAVSAAVIVVAAFALLPAELFRDIFEERYGKILMYREQVTDIVMVTENDLGARHIRYGDGRGTAGTTTYREDRAYAHIAMLPHPKPERVLNICFGVGNSLSSVAQYPVESIDAVELSPGVVKAAPFFESTNRKVLEDSRVALTIQDGRNFLLTDSQSYDIIRLDPPELHTAGVVNLYTKEFFELARARLAAGGIFSIWVNVSYTPESEIKMILQTAAEVFPHVSVWHGPWLYSWVINGSVEPHPVDMKLLTERFEDPAISADLQSIPIRDPFEFLHLFVMADDQVRAFAGDAPVITDDHTRLDFSVPRSAASAYGISNHITDRFLEEYVGSDAAGAKLIRSYCEYKHSVLPEIVNLEEAGYAREEVREKLREVMTSAGVAPCIGSAQAETVGLVR